MHGLVLQLADGAFPTGGFAHSAGLESAVSAGVVHDETTLRGFVRDVLWQAGHGALPFVTAAHRRALPLIEIDRRCALFLRPSAVAHRASETQGRAFLDTCVRIFGHPGLIELQKERALIGHHAPLFGATLAVLEVSLDDTQRIFLHHAVRGVASAAVRLGVIGPNLAQRIHSDLLPESAGVLATCGVLDLDHVAQTAPLAELVGATHDRLYARLFQS